MAPTRFPAAKVDPSPLAQPLTFEFSGKTAKNRFLKAAMTEQLSTWDPVALERRGIPTPELVNLYRRWGQGGFGVLLTGNLMIEYDQLEAPGNPIITLADDMVGERFEAFRELAAAAKEHGSLLVAQVSHPGRQVGEHIQKNPISASFEKLDKELRGMRFAKPRAMEEDDFDRVVRGFAHAAEFLYAAGFDGIELHAAHGYLLSQFLSPLTNKRTDDYGGSLLNRARLIFDINRAIRERVPDASFIVGIKVNSVEFQDEGFTPEDCRLLCAELERARFDFVELSGGNYQEFGFKHVRESTRRREAFFLEFADAIIPELRRTRSYVTGGFRTADAMVRALDTVDGVGLARPACNELDLAQKILDAEVDSAIQTLLDEDDFTVTVVAAGTQMRNVGMDKAPLDLSREDHKNIFEKSMEKWRHLMSNNHDQSKYGYVDIEDITLEPYGAQYVAVAEGVE